MTKPVEPWIVAAFEKKTWCPTRGGDKHRVICVDAPGDYPVVLMTTDGRIFLCCADGRETSDRYSSYDLLPPRRKFDVCVYFNQNTNCIFTDLYNTRPDCRLLARATIEEGSGV